MIVPDQSHRFRLRLAIALVPAAVAALVLLARAARSPVDPEAHLDAVLRHGEPDGPALPLVRLRVPSGVFRNPPGLFVWEAYPGASSYRLTVSDQDMIWPLARRESTGTELFFPTSERRAWSAPRRYSWLVEAFGSDPGNLIARGEGSFAIGEPREDEAGGDSSADGTSGSPAPRPGA